MFGTEAMDGDIRKRLQQCYYEVSGEILRSGHQYFNIVVQVSNEGFCCVYTGT